LPENDTLDKAMSIYSECLKKIKGPDKSESQYLSDKEIEVLKDGIKQHIMRYILKSLLEEDTGAWSID